MLSLRQLRQLLAAFGCDCQLVALGHAFDDPIYPDVQVPDLHAFVRMVDGRRLVSTVCAYHEDLPLPAEVVRSTLARLELTHQDLDY